MTMFIAGKFFLIAGAQMMLAVDCGFIAVNKKIDDVQRWRNDVQFEMIAGAVEMDGVLWIVYAVRLFLWRVKRKKNRAG